MTSEEFDYDSALDSALDLPTDERAAFLASIERDRPKVAYRLKRLVAFALGGGDLPQNVGDTVPTLFGELIQQQDLERIGSQLGPFKVTSLINRGGMGVVFQAIRNDGAYEQTVAIKFLPRLAKTSKRRELFLEERANLARLEHPNIARIIDAGLTDDDIPYFVMEYVAGKQISEYCEGISERKILKVFRQVCDAISHCHQSFVVHGDIKPQNILVAEGRVRLLDFGVGKWLEGETSHDGTNATGFSKDYAAPELLKGGSHTIASDIYSLGTLLRTLLTQRGTKLPIDLQLIVNHCTTRDPAKRFRSVETLRTEINDYLGGFPISSRKAETTYTVGKFIQRNKTIVFGTTAVFTALIIGLTTALWQYGEAKTEAHRAEETSTFVKSLFERINPETAGNEEVTLRQVLDETAIRIENEMQSSPDVRAEVMALIASGYSGLGDYEKSLAFHDRVLRYHQETKKQPHLSIAKALGAIGPSYAATGDYELARATMHEAVAQFETLGEADTLEFAQVLGRYALLMTNRTGGPEEVRTAIELLERKGKILDDRAPENLYLRYIHLTNLASGYDELGDHAHAAKLKEEAVRLAEGNNDSLRISAITALCNLGYSYDALGRYEDAIKTYKKCIARRAERLGDKHPDLISAQQNLAAAYIAIGEFDKAKQNIAESVDAATELLPENSFTRLAAEINLARLNILTNDAAKALETLPSIRQRMEDAVGKGSASAARVSAILGKAYLDNGEKAQALATLRNAYEILKASPYWKIPGHHWGSDVTVWRAEAEFAEGNLESASSLATQGLKMRQAEQNVQAWRLAEAERILAETTEVP